MDNKLQEILGRSINTTKELKKQIVDLQNVIKDLGTDEESLKAANDKLNAAQAEYTSTMNAGKQAVDAASTSIKGMELEYKNLYNTYKMLSDEQRNTDFGKQMAESLNALSDKLNESKKEVGNYKDNIGRYAEGVINAFNTMGISMGSLQGPMKLASQGVDGFRKSLSKLEKGTVILMAVSLAFKALQAIVDKVKNAINANEESQMKLKEAMAAFQPIIDGVTNAFDILAQGVVKVIGVIGDVVNAFRVAGAAVTDFFHITKGAKDAVKEQIAAYADVAKSQNEYIERQREVNKVNATDKAKVEDLKNQAAATSDLNERTRLLNDAKDIQAEIDKRNIKLAKENLRILQTESEFTANDAEANERLAAAKAAVEEARAAANANAKAYNRQITTLTESSKKYQETLRKEKDALEAIELRIKENTESEVEKLTKKYKEEKALMEKYHKDTTELTKQYNEEVNKLNEKAARERIDKAITRASKLQQAYNANGAADSPIDALNIELHKYENLYERLQNFRIKYWETIDTDALEGMTTMKSYYENLEKLAKPHIQKFNELAEELAYLGLPVETIESYQEFLTQLTNVETAVQTMSATVSKNLADLDIQLDMQYAEYYAALEKASIDRSMAIGDRLDMEAEIENNLLQEKIRIKQEELEDYAGTEEQKLALKLEIINLEIEAEDKKEAKLKEIDAMRLERNWQIYDSAMANVDAMSSILDSFSALYKAQIEDGKLTEAQVKKKQKALETMAKVQEVVGIASVVADTAAGITSIWQGYAKERVANAETAAGSGLAAAATLAALNTKSLISAIANTAAMAGTGIAQVASIRGNYISQKSQFVQDNSGDSGAATPAYAIDSTPYSYTRQLQTDQEREDELNKPIWVSVVDIENAQNKVQVREEESTF